MHESIKWPSIFGCEDCQDEIRHYLQCAILWQLAREALRICEDHFSWGHRLCFIDCSLDKLRLLAYSHVLYHSLKNDNECVNAFGIIRVPQFVQQKSSNLVKALRPLVTYRILIPMWLRVVHEKNKHVYVYMYVYTHVCIGIFIYIYVYYLYIYDIYMIDHVGIVVHIYVYIYIYKTQCDNHMCVYRYINIYVYMYTHTYIYIYIYMYM